MARGVNRKIDIVTDTATLALFDPAVLQHRKADNTDWYADESEQIKEITAGRLVLIPTPMDGEYRIRVTTSNLTAQERAAVVATDESHWLQVTSSRLRCGALENVPGASDANKSGAEQTIIVPNGRYLLRLYGIDAPHSPPDDLPNVVVRLETIVDGDTPSPKSVLPDLWHNPPPASEEMRTPEPPPAAEIVPELTRGAPVQFGCEVKSLRIGIFDPEELTRSTAGLAVGWSTNKDVLLVRAAEGDVAFAVSTAMSFRIAPVRVQLDPLAITDVARQYATAPEGWVRIRSGTACIASSTFWPPAAPGTPGLHQMMVHIAPGDYSVSFHFLRPEGLRFPIVVELRALSPEAPRRSPREIVDTLPIGSK